MQRFLEFSLEDLYRKSIPIVRNHSCRIANNVRGSIAVRSAKGEQGTMGTRQQPLAIAEHVRKRGVDAMGPVSMEQERRGAVRKRMIG